MSNKKLRLPLTLILSVSLTFSVLLSYCVQGEEMNTFSGNYTLFQVYYPGSYKFDQVLNNMDSFSSLKVTSLSIIPKVDASTGQLVGAYTSKGDEMKYQNLEMLFDKEYLEQYLQETVGSNVDEYMIISMNRFFDGYIVVISHDMTLSFMTVFNEGQTDSEFIDKKIYSQEEFIELCKPKDCTLVVNNKEIVCDQPPITHYGIVHLPLRSTLEGLGYSVNWDEETYSVIFSDDSNTYKYVTNRDINRIGKIQKNGVSVSGGTCLTINGRTMVDNFFMQFLCREFDLSIDMKGRCIEVRQNLGQ